MIQQECFQNFIKRIVKILWAILVIPEKGAFQELSSQADCVRGFRPAFAEAATRRQV
jgi:hypothetical protein